ncbi:hypothetical protein KIN20_029608 [Parelaphostrongylus tenuis]|uniref:Uncharacterized protein n=1 Tax=Parelaphostrongylus tenuis TaxID=148309 RepID=A0AAD5R2M3_PARTN|nr:hypothetical protein KIN20_029608 [Parelaphostrongylus tenuis]
MYFNSGGPHHTSCCRQGTYQTQPVSPVREVPINKKKNNKLTIPEEIDFFDKNEQGRTPNGGGGWVAKTKYGSEIGKTPSKAIDGVEAMNGKLKRRPCVARFG